MTSIAAVYFTLREACFKMGECTVIPPVAVI